jgi:hypothetical protein
MKTNTETDEKICWACKRILVEESKLGLCPDCLNKYGTPVAAISIGSIASLGIRWVFKNGGKVAKGAFDLIKLIKS